MQVPDAKVEVVGGGGTGDGKATIGEGIHHSIDQAQLLKQSPMFFADRSLLSKQVGNTVSM